MKRVQKEDIVKTEERLDFVNTSSADQPSKETLQPL